LDDDTFQFYIYIYEQSLNIQCQHMAGLNTDSS